MSSLRFALFFGSAVVLLPAAVLLPARSQAQMESRCDNCHTMHNSQANQPMGLGPYEVLLRMDCVACHTGTNTGQPGATPYVFEAGAGEPMYPEGSAGTTGNTLAGGNFYWVAQGMDHAGHNVEGIALLGSNSPPGAGPDNPLEGVSQIRCAGTYGCHGNLGEEVPIRAMRHTHHYNDKSAWKNGLTPAGSYRFLLGVQGFGALDYEYRPTSSSHNKYWGKDRSDESDPADNPEDNDGGTISAHCARCHENFHDGPNSLAPTAGQVPGGGTGINPGTGVWVRHPVDYDMTKANRGVYLSSEYINYNYPNHIGGEPEYSVIAPLAVSGEHNRNTTVQSAIFVTDDDAIIMCLTCHRAHGTPYASALRWNYRGWPAAGFDGCSICHSTKD
ncbi:MAG: cytochrome c3 family protein [Desulfobulbaceae bacterium]|jgi:hypothetical protein|nr:cytochrome c3 family protein [Desulfobulbaceae bacterium]MDY0350773.1 cytochrome c3 family protein [Desulfobulbaceae bacterium]